MLVAFKGCVRQGQAHRATDGLRWIEAALLGDCAGRPGFEVVWQQNEVFPLRREVNRRDPAGVVLLAPLDRQLPRVRPALRAEARQRVIRGKGFREGRGGQRFPASQVRDGSVQCLSVVGVCDLILRFAGRVARGALPLREVGVGEVFYHVIGALRRDSAFIVLAGEPFPIHLEHWGLPGGQAQREQVASLTQVGLNRRRGAQGQRAGVGQDEQVVALCRERGMVREDWEEDQLWRVARGAHLGGDLARESLVLARQFIVEDRGLCGRGLMRCRLDWPGGEEKREER